MNSTETISPARFANPLGWTVILLFSAMWLMTNVYVTVHFRMLDSDSIMYGLPLTVAKNPFDLKIPYLGDFESYGRTWGHQWPGAMWVRAGIFSMIPFSRGLDIGFYLICQWLSAALAAMLVWKVCGARWMALAVGLLVISDRLILTGVQLHRFEALAGLSVMALLAFAWRAGSSTPWYWCVMGCAGAFFAPTMHPYTGPLALVVLGALVIKAFWFRECHWRYAVFAGGFFALGLAALIAWFLLQPEAWEQYSRNVELQKSFSKHFNVVWQGLTAYRFQSGHLLWIMAVVASAGMLSGRPRSLFSLARFSLLRLALPGLVLGIIFLHTVTRCNNHTYLTLGDVAVGSVIAIYACALLRSPLRAAGMVLGAGLIFLSLLWGTVTPYRVLQYARAGFPDLEKVADDILRAAPVGTKVYIPPPLWDSAARLGLDHEYRLWTFAVASSRERRARYEQGAYRDLNPGDVLIVDRLATRNGDVWGILPTEKVLPPDPRHWVQVKKIKRLFPGMDVDFGYDFEIFEYVGGGGGRGRKPET